METRIKLNSPICPSFMKEYSSVSVSNREPANKIHLPPFSSLFLQPEILRLQISSNQPNFCPSLISPSRLTAAISSTHEFHVVRSPNLSPTRRRHQAITRENDYRKMNWLLPSGLWTLGEVPNLSHEG